MRVYISGPMRGYPAYNFPAFHEAACRLAGAGHAAINPAQNPGGLTPAQYMDIDLALLRAAEAVLVLPGWENSKGAAVEVAYAHYLGIPVCVDITDEPLRKPL